MGKKRKEKKNIRVEIVSWLTFFVYRERREEKNVLSCIELLADLLFGAHGNKKRREKINIEL